MTMSDVKAMIGQRFFFAMAGCLWPVRASRTFAFLELLAQTSPVAAGNAPDPDPTDAKRPLSSRFMPLQIGAHLGGMLIAEVAVLL